jgi:hypothetical protein
METIHLGKFLSDFNQTLISSKYFWNILKYHISWQSVHCSQWGQLWSPQPHSLPQDERRNRFYNNMFLDYCTFIKQWTKTNWYVTVMKIPTSC